MYLSYSGWKKLCDCEYSYWLCYVGKVQPAGPDNMVNNLFGSVVGELFDDFYSGGYFAKNRRGGVPSEQFLLDRVESKLLKVIRDNQRKGKLLRWKTTDPNATYESRDVLLEDIRDAVGKGLKSIRFHRLVGRDAKAEVKLDCEVMQHKIAGRADFIMTRVAPHEDRVIIDGKGSTQKNRQYVDPNQLRWYGMLYRNRFQRPPDKLGFLFWRATPTESVDWLAFTEEDLSEFWDSVVDTAEDVGSRVALLGQRSDLKAVKKSFRPKPSSFNCRFCPYTAQKYCPEGHEVALELERR